MDHYSDGIELLVVELVVVVVVVVVVVGALVVLVAGVSLYQCGQPGLPGTTEAAIQGRN